MTGYIILRLAAKQDISASNPVAVMIVVGNDPIQTRCRELHLEDELKAIHAKTVTTKNYDEEYFWYGKHVPVTEV